MNSDLIPTYVNNNRPLSVLNVVTLIIDFTFE